MVPEKSQPCAQFKVQTHASPLLPDILSWDPWDPWALGSVQERKERWASSFESRFSPLQCGPAQFPYAFGALGFLRCKLEFRIPAFTCIRESAELKMKKNSSQEYSIPSLWVGKGSLRDIPEAIWSSWGRLPVPLVSSAQPIGPLQKVPESRAMSAAPVYIFQDQVCTLGSQPCLAEPPSSQYSRHCLGPPSAGRAVHSIVSSLKPSHLSSRF